MSSRDENTPSNAPILPPAPTPTARSDDVPLIGGSVTEEAKKRAHNTTRLAQALIAGLLVSLIVYVPLQFQDMQAWQTFAAPGFLLLALTAAFTALHFLRRATADLRQAAHWLLASVVIAYGGLELIWQGATREIILSSTLLIILIGTIAMPHRWATWIFSIPLMLIFIGLVNIVQPLPRYDIGQSSISHFILIVALFIVLGVLWQSVQLGGQVTLLRRTVSSLQATDDVLRRQLDELTILHAIATAGTEATSQNEFLNRVTRLISTTLYPYNLCILLLNPDDVDVNPSPADAVYASGATPPPPNGTIRASIAGHVARDGVPRRIADVTGPDAPLAPPLHTETRSALCVPLKIEGDVIGVLNVESDQPSAFTEADERLLTTLAGQLATTIDRLESAESARRQARQLATIYDVGRHITSILHLDVLLPEIVRLLAETLDLYNVEIALVEGRELVFHAGYGGYIETPPYGSSDDRVLIGEGITGQAVARGETLRVGDVLVSPAYIPHPLLPEVRSELAIPLRLKDRSIGVLSVKSDRVGGIDAEITSMLETLAAQVTAAVQNAQLYKAAQRQLRELTVLHGVAMAGAKVTDEDALIEQATDLIGEALYPDNFGILLLNATSNMLHFHSSYRGVPPEDKAREIPIGHGITGQVARDGYPRRIADQLNAKNCIIMNPAMRSELCVPLKVSDEIIGVVNAESTQEDSFTPEDERLLTTFANQLSTAIERARLFTEISESLAREQRLNQIARTISGALDLSIILNNVVRLATELVGADAGILALVSQDKDQLTEPYLYNMPDLVGHRSLSKDEGVAWEIIQQGNAILLARYSDHPRALPELVQAGFQSFIGTPVTVSGKTIGALGLFSADAERHFTRRDRALAESIGLQTGVAIQNARLFAQAQERAAELSDALARLQELDQLKNEFIQNVSHELRTPLGIIRGYVELFTMGTLGELQPDQEQPIAIIARRVEMLSKMVEDLTTILEVEAQELQQDRVDIVSLVEASLVDFKINVQNANVTLASEIDPETPPVLGDSLKLRRVMDNLIGNALKFTPTQGTITVRLRGEADRVILEVADTGIGIPETQLERIFERFYQVDGSTKRRYGGTGLGLALVKEIVEAHDGQVSVKSVLGEGSTFRVTLPAAE